jgi:ankyrin repeat protein
MRLFGVLGQTPLTAAIELGLEHCVEALLVAGANANLPDESNKPPLMLATSFGF